MQQLLSKISMTTGIDFDSLYTVAKDKGVKWLLQHPDAPKSFKPEYRVKLKGLTEFMALWAEVEFVNEDSTIDSSSKASEYLKKRLGLYQTERFEIVFLNAQNGVIAAETVSHGTVNEAAVYVRDIVKRVLDHDAVSIILAHNHPGGSPKPSNADIAVTKKIKETLEPLSVKVLDHIIVHAQGTTSMAEQGLI